MLDAWSEGRDEVPDCLLVPRITDSYSKEELVVTL